MSAAAEAMAMAQLAVAWLERTSKRIAPPLRLSGSLMSRMWNRSKSMPYVFAVSGQQ